VSLSEELAGFMAAKSLIGRERKSAEMLITSNDKRESVNRTIEERNPLSVRSCRFSGKINSCPVANRSVSAAGYWSSKGRLQRRSLVTCCENGLTVFTGNWSSQLVVLIVSMAIPRLSKSRSLTALAIANSP